MNGFLSPQGIFHECGFREHMELAEKLTRENQLRADVFDPMWRDKERLLKKNGWIYFGATPDLGTNTDSYVFYDFVDMKMTEEQVKWIEENQLIMTERQYEWLQAEILNDKEAVRKLLFKLK